MKLINHLLAGIAAASGILCAETATSSTAPIGFNKVVCLANSDTIVGIPFRQQGSVVTTTTNMPGAVVGEPDLAEIHLQISNLTPAGLGKHYLKFEGGTRDGRWYDITGNTASSVTIDLNGDDLTGVTTGNRVVIVEYWTLGTLFPPAQATTAWTEDTESPGQFIQNGHAIVASVGTRASARRTELLLPNILGGGINRSAAGFYFIHQSQWKSVGGGEVNQGGTILLPDSILTIRNPSSVNHPTVYRAFGEVVTVSHNIPLHTHIEGQRDTFIGLPRPVDLTLSQLHLWESGAFLQSLNNRASGRRDQLLVFDNSQSSINKSVVAFYYHDGTKWLAVGDNLSSNRNGDVIPSGAGFIIRKYKTDTGQTVFWNNVPSY
jgi:hypothetical protein